MSSIVAYAKRTITVVLASLIAASSVVLAFPANAASNGDWSAYPKRPAEAPPQFTPRQYFFFDLAAGSEVSDVATIKNAKRVPQRLSVYPADAFNVRAGGGFALTPRDKDQTDVGSWVKVSKTEVVVPAAKMKKNSAGKKVLVEGTVDVPFTMTVPRGATPGDHAGGIVTIEPEPSTTITQPSGANLGVRRSLAVRIYTRVSGPLNPQLLITDVRYTKLDPATMPFLGDQGGASIEYTYVNNGNIRITPQTTITYKGFLGRTLHSLGPIPRPEILPGQSITLTDTVAGMPVLDQVTARVEMKGDANADRALTNLAAAGDTTKWSVSWIFVGVLVALIIAGIVWSRVRSRRKKPQARGKRSRSAVSESAPV